MRCICHFQEKENEPIIQFYTWMRVRQEGFKKVSRTSEEVNSYLRGHQDVTKRRWIISELKGITVQGFQSQYTLFPGLRTSWCCFKMTPLFKVMEKWQVSHISRWQSREAGIKGQSGWTWTQSACLLPKKVFLFHDISWHSRHEDLTHFPLSVIS